jgi:stage V sporulation protein D (sporulation-specific penicillin-binding protein)
MQDRSSRPEDNTISEETPQLRAQRRALLSVYKIHILGLILCFFLIILMIRIIYLQIPRNEYYRSLAEGQYVTSSKEDFDRGSIYFSNRKGGLVSAANLKTLYTIALDTNSLRDATGTYELLSRYIPNIDKVDFFEKASKINDPYEKIVDNIEEDTVATLKKYLVKGLTFSKQHIRSYPQEAVGAKILGFVGFSGTTRRGQYGVEKYYDDVLARNTVDSKTNFFAELFADIQSTTVSNVPKFEGNIILTIDAEAERFLHQTLIDTKAQWKSDVIGGIIMDPNTGAIIAMDALPSYDPNVYRDVVDQSYFSNPLVGGVYEMGSIIKPLTMASALDAGAVNEDTTYIDTGFRDLNGYKVRNFDGKARGKTDMQTILGKSLNVGTVFLVEQLGQEKFQGYFKKLGFGQETGIDLPNESKGLTRNLDSNVFVDSATSGFGQGIAITPIQTIKALAALGNGGVMVDPHVVDSIIFENGDTKKIIANTGEQVFTKETSEKISRMLVNVVDNSLKDGAYKMQHYSIAAKTGTAQMVKPGGGYYEDRYLHSFFGYFPAYQPRYIIFLFHTYPKGAQYASATLTDPFFKLVKFLLSYYEVPPDR